MTREAGTKTRRSRKSVGDERGWDCDDERGEMGEETGRWWGRCWRIGGVKARVGWRKHMGRISNGRKKLVSLCDRVSFMDDCTEAFLERFGVDEDTFSYKSDLARKNPMELLDGMRTGS
jgi:hypothetical protein